MYAGSGSEAGWSPSSTEQFRQHRGPHQTEWNLYHMYQASSECVAQEPDQWKELQKQEWKGKREKAGWREGKENCKNRPVVYNSVTGFR